MTVQHSRNPEPAVWAEAVGAALVLVAAKSKKPLPEVLGSYLATGLLPTALKEALVAELGTLTPSLQRAGSV